MGKRNEESRHYAQIWEKVIQQVLEVITEECDEEFCRECSLQTKPLEAWKRALEKEYRKLRRDLKEFCYGNRADDGLLDGRKLAAIFCKALIKEKAFRFHTNKALHLLKERKKELSPDEFNCWAAHNVFLNYKFAYYVSLQLVYLTLLQQLLSSEETKPYAIKLNGIGHLYQYPYSPNTDSFDVNIIIGMARADLKGKDFDMFLFAMQLYQIEMYTVEKLKQGCVIE